MFNFRNILEASGETVSTRHAKFVRHIGTMWFMSKSRRHFLNTSLGLLGAAAACGKKQSKTSEPPAGAPPAFGTAPALGPQVSPSTFAEAEKLVQFELTPAELSQAAGHWTNSLA